VSDDRDLTDAKVIEILDAVGESWREDGAPKLAVDDPVVQEEVCAILRLGLDRAEAAERHLRGHAAEPEGDIEN
jgi:hypothetical protein